MSDSAFALSFWDSLEASVTRPALDFTGAATLESAYAASELAAASIATAGLAASGLVEGLTGASAPVVVDRGLACAWFGMALEPVGWAIPSPWDALAGDYETEDGWIRLHTNAPHHRAAALAVLGAPEVKGEVAAAVRGWTGEKLELAIVSAGGCAAVMHSTTEWAASPAGVALAASPLIEWTSGLAVSSNGWLPTPARPLAGVRVLDLTRVIAGPVATRFLAGIGADIVRVDPPNWNEPAVVPEMTLGKRSSRIDAHTADGLATLKALICDADILVHGYRADALDRLGLDTDSLQQVRPGLIDIAINAYGWSGPWRNRRGFDSLVQMSTGIAERGMSWAAAHRPTPLPVQALDHATGYLAAAAAIEGLRRRIATGTGSIARLSLARTALELIAAGPGAAPQPAPEFARSDLATPWGAARLLESPIAIAGAALRWDLPPRDLGSDEPAWG